jgi:hypothetical protein
MSGDESAPDGKAHCGPATEVPARLRTLCGHANQLRYFRAGGGAELEASAAATLPAAPL